MASSANISGEHVRFEEPPSLSNEPPGGELSNGNSPNHEILIEEDGDYFFDDEEQLPFECREVLGNGYSAVVQEVQHTGTKEIFARKVMKFPKNMRLRVQAEDRYRNEVDIIRGLKAHRHVIQLFASSTTNRKGCLLLQPAADEGNLEDYLEKYSDASDPSNSRHSRRDELTRVLEQAFGCLGTGLAYMHQRGIRHKDIKPQNILIHQGHVIYPDFGASKDTNKDGECTTEGLREFLTRKYAPPEVLENDKRNYAADVYSLGCVFIEMLSALGYSIDHEQEQGQHFSHVMPRGILLLWLLPEARHLHAMEWTGKQVVPYSLQYLYRAMGVFRLGRETQQWNIDSSYRPTSFRQLQSRRARYKRALRTARSLDSNFFQEGRMFGVLFTDGADEYALNAVTDYNSILSRVKYNDHAYSQVRRFIIVKRRRQHCYAIPVFTYGGRGTLKPGVVPDEHAIAYTYGYQPQLLLEEKELRKSPICVVMNHGQTQLSAASRIYFGIHHPIHYNFKVKDLGYVHPEWLPSFLGYWNQENGVDTLQMRNVTHEAATSGL